LPDPAFIAKLANEFFTALPGNPAPSAAVSGPPVVNVSEVERGSGGASPSADVGGALQVPTAGRPPETTSPELYFLEAGQARPWSSDLTFPAAGQQFTFPDVTGLQSPPGAPSATAQNISEDDLRVLPASLGGFTVLASQVPTTAQPPGVPGSAARSVGPEKVSPPRDLPAIPAAGEAFSFPDVPDLGSSRKLSKEPADPVPNSYPHADSTAADNKTAVEAADRSADREVPSPWSPVVELPSGRDRFWFPPAPETPRLADPPQASSSRLTEADLRSIPASLGETNPLGAHVPVFRAPSPDSLPYFLDAEGAAKAASEPRLPSASEFFSFPSAPGIQSLPGTPFIPSSPPATTGRAEPPATGTPFSPRPPFETHRDTIPDLQLSRHLFDAHAIRRDFPILHEQVHGRPLIWLDNAATTQKPQVVIDRISGFYEHENSNIHRAAHTLAARATDAYESAREKVRRFLNAPSAREIVFARGATEAINLAAQSWGKRHIAKDDEIVISWIEHHSNIVPWQMLCAEKGAKLRVAPVDNDGQIILDEYERLLNPRTKLVSLTQVSNAFGTILPVREMIQMAHRHGARVLIDGAQSVAHMRVDVQAMDCDFFVFSGHKIFAPTGIGVLYGKPEVLAEAPPWQGGGSMIVDVTFEKSIYQQPPARFEAGTGNIADAVGLGAALDYLDHVGLENITRYEHDLLLYAMRELCKIPGLRLIGTAREKAGVISFVLEGHRTEEIGAALDREGIAVRAGHHCAQPALRRFGLETTVRPSLALYNTYEDIDALVAAVSRLQMRPT
jgi:cysteine desulfurase/selenocysteine lyase